MRRALEILDSDSVQRDPRGVPSQPAQKAPGGGLPEDEQQQREGGQPGHHPEGDAPARWFVFQGAPELERQRDQRPAYKEPLLRHGEEGWHMLSSPQPGCHTNRKPGKQPSGRTGPSVCCGSPVPDLHSSSGGKMGASGITTALAW